MRRRTFELSTMGGLVRTGLALGALSCALLMAVRLGQALWTRGPLPETAAEPPPPELLSRHLEFPVRGVSAAALVDSFQDARSGDRTHHALDIMAPRGTPVVAVDDGVVVKLHQSAAGGISVYQFDGPGQYGYYYAHLDRYADGLQEGQPVRRGDLLGYVGSTGNAPESAPHLHFAVFRVQDRARWWGGQPLNPFPLWR
jgi:murein DD-endopeptidase MepM/ murein hydrolase activator NlpD